MKVLGQFKRFFLLYSQKLSRRAKTFRVAMLPCYPGFSASGISISASIVVGFSFSTMVDESQICSRAVLNTKYFEVSALDKDVVLVLA